MMVDTQGKVQQVSILPVLDYGSFPLACLLLPPMPVPLHSTLIVVHIQLIFVSQLTKCFCGTYWISRQMFCFLQ